MPDQVVNDIGIALYVLEVVVLPAVIAAAAAAPFLFGRLRERRFLVEAAVASAICLAFALSFVAELDLRAILRQFVTIDGDDAPFERWHRVGLVAFALLPVAWILSALRARLSAGKAALATFAAALVVGAIVGGFVRFPGMTPAGQVALGIAVPLCAGVFWRAHRDLGWSAWLIFGCLAAFSAIDGFASLAVMCGAASAAAFGISLLAAVGRPRALEGPTLVLGGAAFVALGALAATLIACGMSYGTLGLGNLWPLAIGVVIGDELARPIEKRVRSERAKAALRVVGMLLLAGLLVGFAIDRTGRETEADVGGEDLLEMYGG